MKHLILIALALSLAIVASANSTNEKYKQRTEETFKLRSEVGLEQYKALYYRLLDKQFSDLQKSESQSLYIINELRIRRDAASKYEDRHPETQYEIGSMSELDESTSRLEQEIVKLYDSLNQRNYARTAELFELMNLEVESNKGSNK
ncbi:hypothetical protein QEH52_19935 [Coraliomargarita sp. SDUM461003]|uniref:Uncharacterized protein n=1 Tax=Thalassobacterium maritimum TaxID=3041265 RepID=A0ABU1B085_9BACT|nr:hypothetical protein [Coraliomargarita sp. SDUM461003]MDQ8209800.1 hypothetical protein [Coraliomargarita sp. SDUM461003]